jgi:hypothetical protein
VSYAPKEGDVVTAVFAVKRKARGEMRDVERSAFGSVQQVTPKRVLAQTLKTSFLGFSKTDVWVPRESVRLATAKQRKQWEKAMEECDSLVNAFRDAYVSKEADCG